MAWAAAPKLPSELLDLLDFGGTELTLPVGDLVKVGLKEGPEASDAKGSKLLAALTDTVDLFQYLSHLSASHFSQISQIIRSSAGVYVQQT